jgi:hypothetical protein
MEKTYSLVDIKRMYQVTMEESKTLIQEITRKDLKKMKIMKTEEILSKLNNPLAVNSKQNRAMEVAECKKVQLQSHQCLLHNTKMMKRT